MTNIYFYPNYDSKQEDANPYVHNYLRSISGDVIISKNLNRVKLPRGFDFLRQSFSNDAYIVNWLEDIDTFALGGVQSLMTMLGLLFIHIRKKKIIWMFHNMHPHRGETFWSNQIKKILYKYSSIIIAHSYEAKLYAEKHTKKTVVYKCHPVSEIKVSEWAYPVDECDILIWGSIYPYKGVYEFLKMEEVQNSNLKIRVVGKCKDDGLSNKILALCSGNIVFENRSASFDEIAAMCKKARCVLFPYVGNSISSSGVLIDTLCMGGVPVGPNRGAFMDLAKEGCCITYDSPKEILSKIERIECIDKNKIREFCNNNSWDSFGHYVLNLINDNC